MILINAFITDLYWAWISYIMELFSLKILLLTFPFFSIPVNFCEFRWSCRYIEQYWIAASEVEAEKLSCTIWKNKDPLSCAYFINCKCIWERFASHGVRTPLITDESMAIYTENTDIDTTYRYLCKFEARKRKVLRRARMLETVARIKNL